MRRKVRERVISPGTATVHGDRRKRCRLSLLVKDPERAEIDFSSSSTSADLNSGFSIDRYLVFSRS